MENETSATLRKQVQQLASALSDLLDCTERHVFGDECKVQRDNAKKILVDLAKGEIVETSAARAAKQRSRGRPANS